MSQENVKQFYQLVATEESLRTKMVELFKPYQNQAMDESKKLELVENSLLPLAAEQGMPFSAEDLRLYEQELSKESTAGELNADELDAVAGGNLGGAVCFIIGVGAGILDISLCFIVGIDL